MQSFCLRLSPAGFDDASETLPFYFGRSSTIISSAPINFCLFLLHECRSPFLSLVQGSTNCSILPSWMGEHGEHVEHGKDEKHQPDNLKHYICDSKHPICPPDDSNHSISWHLWHWLKNHNICAWGHGMEEQQAKFGALFVNLGQEKKQFVNKTFLAH